MHARKPRYDESFVDTEPAPGHPSGEAEAAIAKVEIVGAGNAEYVSSPARELQQEIQGRLQNSPAMDPDAGYSPRTSILIIAGLSATIWAGLLGIGWLVAG